MVVAMMVFFILSSSVGLCPPLEQAPNGPRGDKLQHIGELRNLIARTNPAGMQPERAVTTYPGESNGASSMSIIWAIIIGFLAGLVAKWITPGENKPSGFILTTVLGIIGSVLATWLGQAIGWYGPGDGAGFIASIVGAVIILLIWGQIAKRR